LPSTQNPQSLEDRVKALEDQVKQLQQQSSAQDGDMAWLSRTSVPVGAVIAFAGVWPPAGVDANNKPWTEDSLGWILCDNRLLTAPKYAALKLILNKSNAPDLRGYFLRGYNPNATGVDPGRQVGDVQTDDLKKHHHTAHSTTTFSHAHKLPGWAVDGRCTRWWE
jgi:Phage Tail Collar Domain